MISAIRPVVLCLTLSASILTAAESQTAEKSLLEKELKIEKLSGVRVHLPDKCRAAHSCAAFIIEKNTPSAPRARKMPGAADVHIALNPAATICPSYRALPETLIGINGGEIAICRFNDGSFFNGWDLIRRLEDEKEGQ